MTKHWPILVTASLAVLLAPPLARADIFQWEYINPANPGLGKQPSTTLAPNGAGANAAPGADLSYRNLTKAYLIGADLSYGVEYDYEGYPYCYAANLSRRGERFSSWRRQSRSGGRPSAAADGIQQVEAL